jgi:hypothetical protein
MTDTKPDDDGGDGSPLRHAVVAAAWTVQEQERDPEDGDERTLPFV